MILEELKQMSDEELNELAAKEIMGWATFNKSLWDPSVNIKDAMELIKKTNVSIDQFPNGEFYAGTPARAITIASILAKGE